MGLSNFYTLFTNSYNLIRPQIEYILSGVYFYELARLIKTK